jgi:hypothetical protein
MIFTCPGVQSHHWKIGSKAETKVARIHELWILVSALKPVFLSRLKNLGSAPPVADARMRLPPPDHLYSLQFLALSMREERQSLPLAPFPLPYSF